jgi:hypothetical protein
VPILNLVMKALTDGPALADCNLCSDTTGSPERGIRALFPLLWEPRH